MKVTFLGVGAAVSVLPNTSLLVDDTLLVDCGFAVTRELWTRGLDADALDAVFITHGHGDHVLGLPGLLLGLHMKQRTRALTVYCPAGLAERLERLVRDWFPEALDDLDVTFTELAPGATAEAGRLRLTVAATAHQVPSLAVRVSGGERTLCHSGDGRITTESEALYAGADLLVHEAFTLDGEKEGHANAREVFALAGRVKAKRLAIVHIHDDEREKVRAACPESASVPEPGETVDL